MIRWSYVVPRLILLAAACVLVWLGLDPALRWTLVRLGESVSAAKVDLGQATTHLADAEVTLRNVQVANAHDPARNLFEAREITLGFEVYPLLKRRFVVREGRVTGLRLGTQRTASGALEFNGRLLDLLPENLSVRLDPGPIRRAGQAWLDRFAMLVKQDITEEVDQLQSVRLAKDLSTRWPAELDRMAVRAEQIKARADRLRALAKDGSDNPLRNLEKAPDIVADVESLQRDVVQFRSQLERLHDQALRDKESILAARDEDLRHIRQQLRLDDLESGGLSEYLLGPELYQRLQTAIQWVHWMRQQIPAKAGSSGGKGSPGRMRGVDVLFAGLSPQPDFLIRSLDLEGEGQTHGQRFEFQGTAKDLTPQPAICGQPAVLHLDIRGPVAMQLDAVLDRTQPVARDYITVVCPAMAQPKRLLGKPGQVAVAISPGKSRVSLQLDLAGDALFGRLSMRQDGVELKPELDAHYGGESMAGRLQGALREVRSLDAAVLLSGTLEKPTWKIRSSLGSQLARAFQTLLQKELETRREEVSQLVQAKVQGEMARFDQTFPVRQQALLAKLQQNGIDVEQLHELASRQVPGLDRLLDKNGSKNLEKKVEKNLKQDLQKVLPADLPFRF